MGRAAHVFATSARVVGADGFWSLVTRGEPDACWPYVGSARCMWGPTVDSRRRRPVHASPRSIAWALAHDLDMSIGRHVVATCGNDRCCNVAHMVQP